MAYAVTTRKRLTKNEKKEREESREQLDNIKSSLSDKRLRVNKLRSKDKEFHGLDREFITYQKDLLEKYKVSADIKHPRDVGSVREELLKDIFINHKLLPKRYVISDKSTRVASTTGHISNEIDMLFYDLENSISLMQRQNIYEVLPVECCYGVVQVKSKLTKKEIKSAFENIKSFKSLKKCPDQIEGFGYEEFKEKDGFGIIFAYDTDMD